MTESALAPITIHGVEYADLGYCRTPFGGLHDDGPVIHTVYCRRGGGWGDSAVSGSDCIQPGQDGASIQRAREKAAENRRFTPPEYRATAASKPGPAIVFAREQMSAVLALRGRPRTGDGSAEWTTWETYTQPHPRYAGGPAEHLHTVPAEMSPQRAAEIVAEYEARLPHYEFALVAARLVLVEERLA